MASNGRPDHGHDQHRRAVAIGCHRAIRRASVTAAITVSAVLPGTYTWTANAFRSQDCSDPFNYPGAPDRQGPAHPDPRLPPTPTADPHPDTDARCPTGHPDAACRSRPTILSRPSRRCRPADHPCRRRRRRRTPPTRPRRHPTRPRLRRRRRPPELRPAQASDRPPPARIRRARHPNGLPGGGVSARRAVRSAGQGRAS